MGSGAPRPNKSLRRKPGDREPQGGQIPSLTLRAFMGWETGAARQRDYVRATMT